MQQIFTILPHENFLRTATKYHRSKSETTRSKSHQNLLRIPSPEAKKKLETKSKRDLHRSKHRARTQTRKQKGCIIPICNGRLETSSFPSVMSRVQHSNA
jgi:hypothetical protein